ncbi:hypothetical protein GCM10007304_22800 [Rhodococcoides trifolii]|uniref:Uncharacterized protein n=1 Tax=Rhodococcoides trifolii TaxID=908250 RepID=A0A917D195_9NOCA|nr:hypothetical protein [Rhodococcus trifolii]GGG08147.1 hypothetical protein GCM10007304_22800 [Rhodococcus trifolii]
MDDAESKESRRRWGATLGLMAILSITGDAVGPIASDPSIRDWVRLILWTVGTIYFAFNAYAAWQKHRRRPDRPAKPVAPADVAEDDVLAATETSCDRIESIKSLRVRYPGLAFRDARELVDRYSRT